jgi:hypothetical protein
MEESNESSSSIYRILKVCIQLFGLCCNNVTSISADNVCVNFGKRKSVYKHLLSDNNAILKVNCNAHMIHNYCKKRSDVLYIDIGTVILKAYGHFSPAAKKGLA